MEENNNLSQHFEPIQPKRKISKLLRTVTIIALLGGCIYAFLKYDGMQYFKNTSNNFNTSNSDTTNEDLDTISDQLNSIVIDSLSTGLSIYSDQDSSLQNVNKEGNQKKSIFEFNKDYSLEKTIENEKNAPLIEQKNEFTSDNNFQKFVVEKGNDLFLKNKNKEIITYSSCLNIVSLLAKQALEDNYCNDVTRSILKSFVSNENIALIAIISNEGKVLYATDANYTHTNQYIETNKIETYYEENKIVTKLPLYQVFGRIGEVIIKTKEKE